MNPSTSTQEPTNVFDFVSRLSRISFDSRFYNGSSTGDSPFVSNFLSSDVSKGFNDTKKQKVVASLSVSKSAATFLRVLNDFNRAIRFHCERIPLGFASIRVASVDNKGLRDDGCGVLEEEGFPFNGVGAEKPKKVLILMSDTGGGHRASAEAIKTTFHEEFGDEYQVSCYFSLSSFFFKKEKKKELY